MKVANPEAHEASPLDFDHDGRVSAFELVAAAAVGTSVLGAAFMLGVLFVSVFC